MIKRSARKHTYTTIDNQVFNSGLSYRAMGLLAYLLSKPDYWEVSTAHLVKVTEGSASPAKRDAVRAILAELIDTGFMTRQAVRESGAFKGYDYTVHDEKQLNQPETDYPAPVEPKTDYPAPVNPPQVNTDKTVNTEVSKKTIGSSADKPPVKTESGKYDPEFETAWKRYPKREGSNPKNKAYSAWKARLKAGVTRERLANGVSRYLAYCDAKGSVGTGYVMQAVRFFGPGEEYDNYWAVAEIKTGPFIPDDNDLSWADDFFPYAPETF